ncbi:MAG: holo-ACP synthase [Candidatus Omnitrophica bacterium]|nr:holo-ACP synthase [Candidatus Omnitrophota bacterium]MBU1128513.1 holo-ACP synthase [Candidatus Omnitrophota bacterium]MBU1656701.1 holo-ACP synthase [Candidatus Omnitrophota bacterium]MBU1784459.1 holo-ACP synthase [Candidatus Omnitrophota bacterium]MBU1851358.1 holo-ACP synthase [Candidatus Omnitrophota bacterium]
MNMAGIGIDSVDIERFKKAAKDHGIKFFEKIFTVRELEYAGTKKDNLTHMAGKFAAKEAVKKAIPDGAEIGLRWTDIEILNSEDGKPYAVLHGQAEKLMKKYNLTDVHVSISHTHKVAVSNAVVMKDGA